MTSAAAENEPWHARYRGMRVLEVLKVRNVTPLMRRVTLGGSEIGGIPDGPNLKLVFPAFTPAGEPLWPTRGEGGKPAMPPGYAKPVTRTYSVRRLDRQAGELDVDFVMHGDGVASTWAQNAKPGDRIGIGGPGGLEVRPADWYVIAGDHTALPAISRILETLPAGAEGQAFVEVPDASEHQELNYSCSVTLNWIDRGGVPAGKSEKLIEAVREAGLPAGKKSFVWVAAESGIVRSLRQFMRGECGLSRKEFLAIGYWRLGMSEPEYDDRFGHDRDEDLQALAEQEHAHHATHGA